jgi:hypothetical protein
MIYNWDGGFREPPLDWTVCSPSGGALPGFLSITGILC